jgi:hypothetical protein
MTTEINNDEEHFPVLNEVVTPGDEAIIKTSRLGHEVMREIEELEDKNSTLSPADLSRGITEKEIELLVDELLEKHMSAMRIEFKDIISQLMLKKS